MDKLLAYICLLVIAPRSSAQTALGEHRRPRQVPSSVRNAGVLHLSTQTWTRKISMAGLGAADVIYDNTCVSGYFQSLSGDRFVDEGRLPSTTSPTNLNSRPGCQNAYNVDGFQIAYCTDQVGFSASNTIVNFYDSYASCTTAVGLTPAGSATLTGLPGSTGAAACWVVTIDPISPFALTAGAAAGPLFGWSIENDLPASAQSNTGPLFAGDPNTCKGFDGTRWDNGTPPAWPNNLLEAGTGMGTGDLFRIEPGISGGSGTTPGCYFFNWWPFYSFHLELYDTDACAPSFPCPVAFCPGDGTGAACPCGNTCTFAEAGCMNSVGCALLTVGGSGSCSGLPSGGPFLSNDTIVLLGSGMPDASALYFQGTTRQLGGAGVAFGDGKRCLAGTLTRLGTTANVGGSSHYPASGDPRISSQGGISTPGIRTYQIWYRNAAQFCTAATFNLSNGYEITWVP